MCSTLCTSPHYHLENWQDRQAELVPDGSGLIFVFYFVKVAVFLFVFLHFCISVHAHKEDWQGRQAGLAPDGRLGSWVKAQMAQARAPD